MGGVSHLVKENPTGKSTGGFPAVAVGNFKNHRKNDVYLSILFALRAKQPRGSFIVKVKKKLWTGVVGAKQYHHEKRKKIRK